MDARILKKEYVYSLRAAAGSTALFFPCPHVILFSLLFFLLLSLKAFPSQAGDWVQEKGKWYFYEASGVPLENEWLEWNGKWYYFGNGGQMKTGFFTDPGDGRRYYLGPDGVLVYNTFVEDGKYYIGDWGIELTRFDDYRKKTEKALKALVIKNRPNRLETDTMTGVFMDLPVFALYDLNEDGFRDILAFNRADNPDRVLSVQIWQPEESEYAALTESDPDDFRYSFLRRNNDTGFIWLHITDGNYLHDFFYFDMWVYRFVHQEHYDADVDEYGEVIYYYGENDVQPYQWGDSVNTMEEFIGQPIPMQLAFLHESIISDVMLETPSQEELHLWESVEESYEEATKKETPRQ